MPNDKEAKSKNGCDARDDHRDTDDESTKCFHSNRKVSFGSELRKTLQNFIPGICIGAIARLTK
jgi:hypothetical protein